MRLVCSVGYAFKVAFRRGLLFLAESWHEGALTRFVRDEKRDQKDEDQDTGSYAEEGEDVLAIKLCSDRPVRVGFRLSHRIVPPFPGS